MYLATKAGKREGGKGKIKPHPRTEEREKWGQEKVNKHVEK